MKVKGCKGAITGKRLQANSQESTRPRAESPAHQGSGIIERGIETEWRHLKNREKKAR
jgi:hypothetical protein